MEVKQTKAVNQTKRRGLRGRSRNLQGRETQGCDIQGRSRSRSKLLLLPCLAIAVMLVAASCGGSGAPTGFGDEDGGATVKKNFIEGCEVSVKDDSQLDGKAKMICECTYDRIVGESQTSERITFEDFDEVDDDLREDINKLSEPTNDRVISKIREYMRDSITELRTRDSCEPNS